jgi:peptide-methionine (R)-S-oxide reductase
MNIPRRPEKPYAPHQRPSDEQEGADRPLVPKDRPPVHDPGRDPHHALNNPVGEPDPTADSDPYGRVEKSDAQWREDLTPAQYDILRRKGTEPAFSGAYVHTKDDGMYRCAGCGAPLFSSDTKFDSGTGWPSFTEAALAEAVELHEDRSHGMVRTEVTCARCGGHLGHVFPDGPGPDGQRFCINSSSLELDPRES